jgi:hypothetical protein
MQINNITEYPKLKAYGVSIELHPIYNFISIDKNGDVKGHIREPQLVEDCWISDKSIQLPLSIDYEGDILDSLRYVRKPRRSTDRVTINEFLDLGGTGPIDIPPTLKTYAYISSDINGVVKLFALTPKLVDGQWLPDAEDVIPPCSLGLRWEGDYQRSLRLLK